MFKFRSQVIDSLARIETKLESGEKQFKEFKKTHDWVKGFKGYLKALGWILGIGSPIATSLIIWYVTHCYFFLYLAPCQPSAAKGNPSAQGGLTSAIVCKNSSRHLFSDTGTSVSISS